MLTNLKLDYGLRGYTFEYIARILLRRKNNNNFIFQANRFDSIQEIIKKYRLKTKPEIEKQTNHINKNWNHFDLIEFVLENKETRQIQEIIIYEVKTKGNKTKRNYFEACLSNHKFLRSNTENNIKTFICSIILFENWRFSFNILPYEKCRVKSYSNFKSSNN